MNHLEIEYKFRISPQELENIKTKLSYIAEEYWELHNKDRYYRFETPIKRNNEDADNQEIEMEYVDARIREHFKKYTKRDGQIVTEATSQQNSIIEQETLICHKEKHSKTELELNHEHESSVHDAEVFDSLFRKIGGEIFIKKEKIGWGYKVELSSSKNEKNVYANVELIEVKNLGLFLEIETLVDLVPYEALDEQKAELPKDENSIQVLNNNPTENEHVALYIQNIEKKLAKIIDDLGVDKTQIEPRLYMDMLAKDSIKDKIQDRIRIQNSEK